MNFSHTSPDNVLHGCEDRKDALCKGASACQKRFFDRQATAILSGFCWYPAVLAAKSAPVVAAHAAGPIVIREVRGPLVLSLHFRQSETRSARARLFCFRRHQGFRTPCKHASSAGQSGSAGERNRPKNLCGTAPWRSMARLLAFDAFRHADVPFVGAIFHQRRPFFMRVFLGDFRSRDSF